MKTGHPGLAADREPVRPSLRRRLASLQARAAGVEDWAVFVPWTLALAVVLVGLLRLLQTWALGTGHAVVGWIGIAPGVVVAASCIALLLWAYWHIHLDPTKTGPYVVVALSAATTVLVCAESFAGVTTLLWQHGLFAADADLDLWAAEHHYLWQLVNAVPFVEAPETVGWSDPAGFANAWGGSLVLVFKLLVIVPLVQVAIAAYRLGQRSLGAAKRHRSGVHAAFELETDAGDAWGYTVAVLVPTVLASVALVLLVDRSSVVNRLADDHLGDGVDVGGTHLALSWAQLTLDFVVAGCFVWLLLAFLGVLADEPLRPGSLRAMAGAGAFYVLLVPLMTVTAASTTLALLHAGFADASPAIPRDDEIGAAIGWYAWHLADAIPLLDIPASFGWSLEHEFVDHWSRAILLVAKLFFFTLLIVPLAHLVRSAAHRLQPPAPARGQLREVERFAHLLSMVQLRLDEAHEAIVARADEPGPQLSNPGESPVVAARGGVRELEDTAERVRAVFGEGGASDAADAAVVALVERLDTVEWASFGSEHRRLELDSARAEAISRAEQFAVAASAALQNAARGAGAPAAGPSST